MLSQLSHKTSCFMSRVYLEPASLVAAEGMHTAAGRCTTVLSFLNPKVGRQVDEASQVYIPSQQGPSVACVFRLAWYMTSVRANDATEFCNHQPLICDFDEGKRCLYVVA